MPTNKIEIITEATSGEVLAVNILEHRPTGRRIISKNGAEEVEVEKHRSSIGIGDGAGSIDRIRSTIGDALANAAELSLRLKEREDTIEKLSAELTAYKTKEVAG